MSTAPLPDVMTLDVERIAEPKQNPNHMPADKYAALVRVIDALGFFQPLLVRTLPDGSYEVVDGVHRLRAAKQLKLPEVLAVVVDGMSDQRATLAQLSMNRLRGELNLTESAALLSDLRLVGLSDDEMRLSGFNTEEIDDMLRAARTTDGLDMLDLPVGGPDPKPPQRPADERPWLLELRFKDEADFKRARRFLARVGGKGVNLADALVSLAGTAGTTKKGGKS